MWAWRRSVRRSQEVVLEQSQLPPLPPWAGVDCRRAAGPDPPEIVYRLPGHRRVTGVRRWRCTAGAGSAVLVGMSPVRFVQTEVAGRDPKVTDQVTGRVFGPVSAHEVDVALPLLALDAAERQREIRPWLIFIDHQHTLTFKPISSKSYSAVSTDHILFLSGYCSPPDRIFWIINKWKCHVHFLPYLGWQWSLKSLQTESQDCQRWSQPRISLGNTWYQMAIKGTTLV